MKRFPKFFVLSFIVVSCAKSPETPPAATTGSSSAVADSSHATAQASDPFKKGESAHEVPNADGIVPTVANDGSVLVGWDELVKNASKYKGKHVHVKSIIGGVIPEGKGISTGYLFPIDMDTSLMNALMDFTMHDPSAGASMPVLCRFDKKSESEKVSSGKISVIDGEVKILKTGEGTGFTQQRGIHTANYVVLQHAKMVE